MKNIKMFIDIKTLEHGKWIVQRSFEANSFTSGWLFNSIGWMLANAAFTLPAGLKYTDNTAWASVTPTTLPESMSLAGTTGGIVVGTSGVANTITQYQLNALVAHGAGAGQLSYGVNTYAPATCDTIVGNVAQVFFNRPFTNNSGNTISISESGIIGRVAAKYVLFERSVFAPFNILNLQTISVEYRMQVTV